MFGKVRTKKRSIIYIIQEKKKTFENGGPFSFIRSLKSVK